MLSALVLFAVMTPAAAGAQTRGPDKRPQEKAVFTVSVDLVQMDVIVTDSDGRHVTDLTAEDFTILQDGHPQEITSFSLVQVQEPAVTRSSVYKKVPQGADAPSAPPEFSRDYRADQIRRVVALVVDDLGISFEGMHYVRESIKKWVDQEMQPGDLVALIRTGKGVGTLQQFTSNKRMLEDAAEHLYYNLAGRVGPGICTDNTVQTAEDLVGDLGSIPSGGEHRRQLTLASLGSVQFVLDGLRILSGRKSMILFTEDLWTVFNQGQDTTVDDKVRRIVRDANHASVVIHAIDSRGLVSDLQCSSEDRIYAQDAMVKLARYTGGRFEEGRNDIDGALYETVRDGDSYYLLGYHPDEKLAKEMRSGKIKHHSIQVRVGRPGLHVRTRSDFLGTPDPLPQASTRHERVEQALYTPFAAGDLPVRLTALFSQTRMGEPRINALVHFDTDKLEYTEDDEGWRKADVELVAALFDGDGQQLEMTSRKITLTAAGDTFREMVRNGVVVRMHVRAKKAGAYQMRVILSDVGSGLMGSATHYVEVPDVRNGHFALSGIALAASRSRLDAIGDGTEDQVVGREVNGTAAVRVFKPGETITWAYQVLNAQTGRDKKAELQTYTRLFHEGDSIYISDSADISLEPDAGSKRMIGIGRMQLNKILPGDYALQVVVRDVLEERKERTAVQSIDFRIQDPR